MRPTVRAGSRGTHHAARMTFRERRPETLSESRMRTRTSGSMSGDWRRIHGAAIATPPHERGGQQLRGTYQHRASRRLHPWCAGEEGSQALQVIDL
jgi:hypothetical protein